MLAWRDRKTEIVESRDAERRLLEPPHAAFYQPRRGVIGALDLIGQARADFLSVWRESDYQAKTDHMRLFGRQLVLVNEPEAIRHVVAKRHDNYERKSPQMRRALEHLIGDGLFISDGATWRSRRPLVSDIVHKNRVPAFGDVMARTAQETVARWTALGPGAEVNALSEMAALTAEIISRAVFGNDLGRDEANEVTEGFTDYQSMVDQINVGYFLGFDEGLSVRRTPALRRAVARVHSVIDRVIEDHLEGKGDDRSMVDLLIRRQSRNPELGLDVVALRNEAATIFMAGHETTASTLTWAWYLLSRAPWVERRVHAEIEAVCGDRAPTIADVPKLDLCRAVIEETLRLYPPVPILARQAKEADRIGAVEVEKAALVLIVPWLLHRSPELHKDPHLFRPRRFLGDSRPAPYSYIPFAAGPRLCPGLQFGLNESVLCLASLAQRFRVRVAEDRRVEPVCRLTVRPKGGLPVTLHPR
ncbi:MAG: cytochrome P450 [Pseudomonadota bacterium]|nr:cytochrome P450 [Pseudomonadota bacterium]